MKICKWKKIGSELEYKGERIKIRRDFFKVPNGEKVDFSILERGEIVAILPITSKNEVVTVRQFRPAINNITTDIPGGGINHGESPLNAAKRELKEETGVIAKKIIKLGTFYPDSGRSEQIRHIYLASELEFKKQKLDEGEYIEIEKISLRKIEKMIKIGGVLEATLVLAVMLYKNNCFHTKRTHN